MDFLKRLDEWTQAEQPNHFERKVCAAEKRAKFAGETLNVTKHIVRQLPFPKEKLPQKEHSHASCRFLPVTRASCANKPNNLNRKANVSFLPPFSTLSSLWPARFPLFLPAKRGAGPVKFALLHLNYRSDRA